MQYVKKQVALDHNMYPIEKDVARMPIELFLSVPLMWHPDACLISEFYSMPEFKDRINIVFLSDERRRESGCSKE